MREMVLAALRESMQKILDPRFYETERGYQGALVAQLTMHLEFADFNGHPIIEQEYQKTLPNHGITIRPDVIVHIPFSKEWAADRTHGNVVAIELKRRATNSDAVADFQSLSLLAHHLAYLLMIFINIDSADNHHRNCPPYIEEQTVCFAARLGGGVPVVSASNAG